MYKHQLNILIETGTDFVLPFTIYDDDNNRVDLTGATVNAHLREYETSTDYYSFVVSHNNSGGKITISLPHELTSQIGYSYGWYDVFVTTAGGTVYCPLCGQAAIRPGVTRPYNGSTMYLVGVETVDDLPYPGDISRFYYVYSERTIYRWNGENYVSAFSGGVADISFKRHVNAYVDEYTITYDDGKTFDYQITTNGVTNVQKISSSGTSEEGIVDTYRMYFYNGSHVDYQVKNGAKGDPGETIPADAFGDLAWLDAVDYKTQVYNKPASASEIMDRILSIYKCIPYGVLLAVYLSDDIFYLQNKFAEYSYPNGLILTDTENVVDFNYDAGKTGLVIIPESVCPVDQAEDRIKSQLGNLAYQDVVDYDTQVVNKPDSFSQVMDRILSIYPCIPYGVLLAVYLSDDIVFLKDDFAEYSSEDTGLILTDTTDVIDFGYSSDDTGLVIEPDATCPFDNLGTMATVDDVPNNNAYYARRNGDWANINGNYYTMNDIRNIVASAFSTSKNYNIGDYVIYNNLLYRFTTAHPAGAWNSAHVTQVQTMTEVQDLSNSKADIITSFASGTLVHIEDGAPYPAEDLTVNIEPAQDLHGQANPYPAGGGKNLLNEANAEIGIAWNGNANSARARLVIPCQPSTTYTLSMNGTNSGATIYRKFSSTLPASEAGTDISSSFPNTFTTASDSAYVILAFSEDDIAQSDINAMKLQLEVGSSATSFAPYSNICPITGWTGVNIKRTGRNLFNPANVVNGWFSAGEFTFTDNGTKSVFVEVKKGKHYTVSKKSGARFRAVFTPTMFDENNTSIVNTNFRNSDGALNATWTPTLDGYMYVYCVNSDEDANTILGGLQIEVSEKVNAYESYQGANYSISWQSTAGTVYGGSLNVKTGVLTVDLAFDVFDGDENITVGKTGTANYYYELPLTNKMVVDNNAVLSNIYPYAEIFSGNTNQGFYIASKTSYLDVMRVRWGEEISVDDYKTYLQNNNVQVVYKLATPQTYQLTPTEVRLLLGVNNIWADTTGTTEVRYHADTKKYIDNKIEESAINLKRMVTAVEASMKATQNYTSGQIIIVGNDIYKAIANISYGSSLTTGTNVTKVTLAEWMLSLTA